MLLYRSVLLVFYPTNTSDCPPAVSGCFSHLMQLSGSLSQSILHMNLSQCSQPMVGVRARPLSKASAAGLVKLKTARRKIALRIFTLYLCSSSNTIRKNNSCLFHDLFPHSKRAQPAPLDERHKSGPINSKCVCSSPMAFLLLPSYVETRRLHGLRFTHR